MPLDHESLREGLAGKQGRAYWRSLEELAETPEFAEYVRREFPDDADRWTDPVTRRQFLVLMGASLALAGVSGCSPRPAPQKTLMPYVRQPAGVVPGQALMFATAMPLGGAGTGLLVASREGRPIKIEGNPSHPASLGGTHPFHQAALLGLYDPDRSQSVIYRGRPRAWNEALAAMRAALTKLRARRGAGLRLLTESVASPTLGDRMHAFLADYPDAKWYQYEPVNADNARAGARQAFGRDLQPLPDLTKARVILALDCDFLSSPNGLEHVRAFADGRRARGPEKNTLNRLYAVEPMLTLTGAKADHRLPVKARDVESVARALASELKVRGAPETGDLPERTRAWATAVAQDLEQHRGASLVLAGDAQPAIVHALAHALNEHLGNVGKTVRYVPRPEIRPANQGEQLRTLVEEMNSRSVDLLFILGGNPVFTAPVDLDFAAALRKVPLGVHLGLYRDETAVLCDWHLPEAHVLESWGDVRASDGTVSLIQPLIEPLYHGRSAIELLTALTGEQEAPGREIVRDYWRGHWPPAAGVFEHGWHQALQNGVIPGTRFETENVSLSGDWARGASKTASDGLEINFRPDPMIHDGRFANNAWLQELPKPITKLTWDNAAILSPATAKRYGLNIKPGFHGGPHGEALAPMIELTYRGRSLLMPAWVVPGHADDSITVHLGYGRTHAGRVGNGTGFNTYALRHSAAPSFDSGLEIALRRKPVGVQAPDTDRVAPETYPLACTQLHQSMEERWPARSGTFSHYADHPDFARELTVGKHQGAAVRSMVPGPHEHEEAAKAKEETDDRRLLPLTVYPEVDYGPPKNRWAMAIDLGACIGCHACSIACQAENNIPVVGKSEVLRGREMHWIRIDRYFEGHAENPALHFQPVPCMHCEKAPCELVCPVGATVHSDDGLNDMVYNRCVGTRYCSNNCPYKVRRFNFFEYADYATQSLKLMHNPEVTVRSRGVMEKCTYCVQRIRHGEIHAKNERRGIRDGEVVTACQAACPAHAITFGDLNDAQSEVYRWKASPLNYALLADQNTQPRTTYLAAVRNPNPEIVRWEESLQETTE